MTRTATFDPSRAVVFDLEVCPGRWCVGFHGIDHAGRLSTPRIRRPGTPKSSTDRTTTPRAWPANRSGPDRAIVETSIPGDARSVSRSAYTSGAHGAWAEIFWIPSRTHQLESDGATGKGPGLPWRSERSSWVVLSVPGGGRVHGIGCGQARRRWGPITQAAKGSKPLAALACYGRGALAGRGVATMAMIRASDRGKPFGLMANSVH